MWLVTFSNWLVLGLLVLATSGGRLPILSKGEKPQMNMALTVESLTVSDDNRLLLSVTLEDRARQQWYRHRVGEFVIRYYDAEKLPTGTEDVHSFGYSQEFLNRTTDVAFLFLSAPPPPSSARFVRFELTDLDVTTPFLLLPLKAK